jgi:hypothetical protein
MTVWAAIVAFLGLCVPLLQSWLANAPERKVEAANEATQADRNAIDAGNAVVLNGTLDGLLSDVSVSPEGTTADSATGQHSGSDTAQQISDVLGAEVVLR